ncbi:MAG: TerB family tellurite resistance protein [Alphaproteobacteria bacterium]|nr:TerB family tellurite resistance protein [Alphaproteobacteria bacterium]
MLERIRRFLKDGGDSGPGGGDRGQDELQLAVAGLLVEAARQDGHFDEAERATIERLLREKLALDPVETAALIELADAKVEEALDLWSFARVVKNRFDHEQRVGMIEMLWEVVYADGVLDDFEASLMRRMTGLVYVSDAESGAARKRAMERLGIAG